MFKNNTQDPKGIGEQEFPDYEPQRHPEFEPDTFPEYETQEHPEDLKTMKKGRCSIFLYCSTVPFLQAM